MDVLARKWTLDLDPDTGRVLGVREGHGLEQRSDVAESVEVVPSTNTPGAVETLDAIARVLDRGTADERKLATITRLVNARPTAAGGQS